MRKRLLTRAANNVRDLLKGRDFLDSGESLVGLLKENIKRYPLTYQEVPYVIEVNKSRVHGEISTKSIITGIKLPQFPGNFEGSQFICDFIKKVDEFYRIRDSYTINLEGFLEPTESGKGSVYYESHRKYTFPCFSSGNFDTESESIASCNRRTRKFIEVYNKHISNIQIVLDVAKREYPQTEEEVAEIVRRLRLPFTLLGNYQSPDQFSHCIYAERTPPLGGVAHYPKWVLMEVAALGNIVKEEAVKDELSRIKRETGDLPREETIKKYKFTREGLCAV